MKLLHKSQKFYFRLLLGVLVVWTVLTLPIMQYVVQEYVDETLHSDMMNTLDRVQKESSTASLSLLNSSHYSIQKIYKLKYQQVQYKDTMLYNRSEQELVPYRQISRDFEIHSQPYRLTLRKSMLEYDDLLIGILLTELILVLLLLGGMYLVNRKLLQKIWKPFYETLQATHNYRLSNDQELKLADTEIDEFDDLNRVIEGMLQRIQKDYKQLKQFTENASHEIQTPLSIIQSRLELLLQQSDALEEEQMQWMGEAYNATGRLSRLNRALLLLTKIENNQFPETQNLDLSQKLEAFIRQWTDLIGDKQLSIITDIQPGVQVPMNEDLAGILMRNLLSNAVKHNVSDGSIHIRLDSDHLEIKNTGEVSDWDPQSYFDRFQKGKADSSSLGLGLSIIQAICDLYDFDIHYEVENGWHIFNIEFSLVT